jgi:hypothetical protein
VLSGNFSIDTNPLHNSYRLLIAVLENGNRQLELVFASGSVLTGNEFSGGIFFARKILGNGQVDEVETPDLV